jgi:F-type H+-transporting ATPase subunit delta
VDNVKCYADALFSLSLEEGKCDKVYEDTRIALGALSENGEYLSILDTPHLSINERIGMIDSAFGSLDGHLTNLIKILAEAKRAHLLVKVLREFENLYDEHRGIFNAYATSAVAMTEAQISALAAKLRAITGKEPRIINTVDPSVLGGVKLRFEGKQVDGTVRGRLEGFEKKLRDTVI